MYHKVYSLYSLYITVSGLDGTTIGTTIAVQLVIFYLNYTSFLFSPECPSRRLVSPTEYFPPVSLAICEPFSIITLLALFYAQSTNTSGRFVKQEQ